MATPRWEQDVIARGLLTVTERRSVPPNDDSQSAPIQSPGAQQSQLEGSPKCAFRSLVHLLPGNRPQPWCFPSSKIQLLVSGPHCSEHVQIVPANTEH